MINGPMDKALTVISKEHSLILSCSQLPVNSSSRGIQSSFTQSPTQMHTHAYIRIVLVKDESVLLAMLDDAENEIIDQFFYPM